jgi:pimeloyl-ACP methyl ester carboxylesterase
MFRLIALYSCLFLSVAAGAADAGPSGFPPGFSDSVVFDPASGRPVQLISGGKAGAPTVVLVHGLGQQASRDWLPLLPQLAVQYRVLIVDLPGFGRSDRPDAALTPKRYAELLHWLIAQQTDEAVFVVGHSLGAAVALRHSHDYPEQVERLLLIDAAGVLQTTVFARHLSKVGPQVAAPGVVQQLVDRGSNVLNRMSGRLQDMTADKAGTLAALAGSDRARGLLYKDNSNISAALGLVNEDFSPLVRNIGVPVWILWGERDPVAPLRTGQALRWLLPQAQLDVLLEVGHVPIKEATASTMAWMFKALQGPLPQAAPKPEQASQGDGVCKRVKDMVFRGKWRTIRLEQCANVRIEGATLDQLIAIKSTVTLDDVTIGTDGTGIEARNSHITATGLRIEAARAFQLDNSRLDLAALDVTAPELGDDQGGSLLFISLGQWCEGTQGWSLHDVWKTAKGPLGARFRKAGAARCQ